MKCMFPVLIALVLATASSAWANTYDDCILAHMAGAQNQTAAYAIEKACIKSSSVSINSFDPGEVFGTHGWASAGSFNLGYIEQRVGLRITLTNDTSYDVTEVVLIITDRKTNKERYYWSTEFRSTLPQGFVQTGPADPALSGVLKSRSTNTFFVEVADIGDFNSFHKNYTWAVAASKGIPNK